MALGLLSMCLLLLAACLVFPPELFKQLLLSFAEAAWESNPEVHNLVPSSARQALQLLADTFPTDS